MIRPRVSRLLRSRRRQGEAWSRLHHERLRLEPALTLGEERGLVGALILEPAMIGVMAPLRPPAWFTDLGSLAVMCALFCLQRLADLSVEDVIDALERHGALELAGGRAGVEALVQASPSLDAARRELDAARARMRPVLDEEIVQVARCLLAAERVLP